MGFTLLYIHEKIGQYEVGIYEAENTGHHDGLFPKCSDETGKGERICQTDFWNGI